MPQNHYSIGGSMAAYSVIGRMRVYEVVGEPFGNDFVPRHAEGSGSIGGAASLAAARLIGSYAPMEGVVGSFVGSGVTTRNGTGQLVGAGSPEARGSVVQDHEGEFRGFGLLVASHQADTGHNIVIQGNGSPVASGRSGRTQTGNSVGAGSPAAAGTSALNFYQMIQAISATASLDVCLDAADINSYSGVGQTWTDLSGSGNSFYRGENSSAAADDPTFNGVAGSLSESEYFGLDGGDGFKEVPTLSFAESWHKNNAAWTMVFVVDLASAPASGVYNFFANCFLSTQIGVRISTAGTSPKLQAIVFKGSAPAAAGPASAADIPTGRFCFLAVALDEATGANGCTIQIDSTQESFTSTYTSPSSSGSTLDYTISGDGGVTIPTVNSLPNGSRVACMAGWSRRLTNTELNNLYAQLQARYSDLP